MPTSFLCFLSARRGACAGAAFALAALAMAATPAQPGAGSGPPPATAPQPAVTFDASFEDASLGRIDVLGPDTFRIHIVGQSDEHGRNRQANSLYFRMNHVAGRNLSLTLTDLVGEYDNRPGAIAIRIYTHPVYSEDGEHWHHFRDTSWDNVRKELTLRYRPTGDTLWVAVVPPYPYSRLVGLLREINRSPYARVEVIGRTVKGRELPMVTITDPAVPDAGKRSLWLITREHAWESGTSFAAEGALRFLVSDDPRARALRRENIFTFLPMGDPDGCATGGVRYNAHGYDLNRHWGRVNLRDKQWLQRMPEIWYMKKAILAAQAQHPIDLLVNFHNDETNEFMETMIDHGAALTRMRTFFRLLAADSTFDPSRTDVTVNAHPKRPTTEVLGPENGVPVVLLEQRVAAGHKLGGLPTTAERLAFGPQLLEAMAAAVR